MSQPKYLLDTGPIVALLNKHDQWHEQAKEIFASWPPPFITCEPVLCEAVHLMGRLKPEGLEEVVLLGSKGVFEVPFNLGEHWKEVSDLLKKYRDQPISLADACLIRMAEIYKEPRILTFDSDFEIYRWHKTRKFEILS